MNTSGNIFTANEFDTSGDDIIVINLNNLTCASVLNIVFTSFIHAHTVPYGTACVDVKIVVFAVVVGILKVTVEVVVGMSR